MVAKGAEFDRIVDAGLVEASRQQRVRAASPPRAVEPEDESAPAPRPAPVKVKPVSFVCNAIPALGIGLAGKMYAFQNAVLELDDPEAIAAIRAHALFGRGIYEHIEMPDLPDELREKLEEPPESQSSFLRPGARPRGPRTIKLMPGNLGVSRRP